MENVPDSVVGFLLNNLKDLIQYNVKLIRDVGENADALLEDIEELKSFVQYCTERNNDQYMETLVNRIRETIYEAEDIIEDYIVSSARPFRFKDLFTRKSLFKDLFKRRSLGKLLEEIRPKVQNIFNRQTRNATDHINVEQMANANRPPRRQIHVGELDDEVVGIKDEIETVIGKVFTEEYKMLEVVSITGMVGLGKTTLAKKVLNHPMVQREFFFHFLVNVSKSYERREVFMNILSSCSTISITKMANMTEDMIVQKIRDQLKDRRYFIVMDDVWSPDAWRELKVVFPNNDFQSRVLITTRIDNVATCAKISIEPHGMRLLSDDESKQLLRLRVFGKNSTEKPADETSEKLILRKCGRLPLAIVVIAGILKHKPNRSDSWKSVAESVGENLATSDESKELIERSFDYLPYHLKPCFIYLGLFPEDFKIPVWKLVRLWMAEGFVEERKNEILEDKAELYLEQLINRNLVIVEKRRLNGRIKTCRLHDALRDFCRDVGMRQHLFHFGNRESNSATSLSADRFRRICSKFKSFGDNNIRTFLDFTTMDDPTPFLEAAETSRILKSFKLLRILDVRSIKFKGFPTELYYLVILKYLAVSSDWTALPEKFSQLQNLQTVIIDTSSPTLQILANIWELERLRHIHIKASTHLPEVVEETIIKPNLQTLSTISPRNCTRRLFQKTRNLKKLGIRGKLATYMEPESGSSLFDNLVVLESLETLKLENTDAMARLHFLPDGKKFPSKITRLTLSNTHLEWKHMSSLGNLELLEVLKLKKHAFVGQTWEMQDGCFHRLEVLHIAETNLVNWKAKASNFKELTLLILKDCKELLSIPLEMAEIQSLQRIELRDWTTHALACAKAIKEKTKNQGFKLDI